MNTLAVSDSPDLGFAWGGLWGLPCGSALTLVLSLEESLAPCSVLRLLFGYRVSA